MFFSSYFFSVEFKPIQDDFQHDFARMTDEADSSVVLAELQVALFRECNNLRLSPWDRGWSGGAKVLSKLSVPRRPTRLDDSRARAYCACSRYGWGLFEHFFSHLYFSFLSPSLWMMARYRLKYCLKGSLNPKTTKQPTNMG